MNTQETKKSWVCSLYGCTPASAEKQNTAGELFETTGVRHMRGEDFYAMVQKERAGKVDRFMGLGTDD